MNRQQATVAVALSVVLAIGALAYLAPRADPFYDDDSAMYVESGRNFAQGRGFVTWPYGAEGLGREFVPLTVFPPGFPFLISIGVRLGATAEAAATWIPRACFVLLPLVLYRVLRFVMGRTPAVVATVISCFTPTIVFHSLCAMSDVPFLLVVLIGFLALFRGLKSGRHRWLLVAGVVAGLAAGMRNAGYAIPVAVTVAFAMVGAGRQIPYYISGFAAGYAPFVLRNLMAFGSVQPYSMPPSMMPVGSVLREALAAFDAMFVARTVPWSVLVPMLAALIVVTTLRLRHGGTLRQLHAAQRARLLGGTVLFLYAAAGVCMILTTRFMFDVDPINPRFLIQYHWVFVGWCTLVIADGLRAAIPSTTGRVVATVVVAGLLLSPQVRVARAPIRDMSWIRDVMGQHAGLRDLISGLPDDACVVAFKAPQLHLMYERPVYQLPSASPAEVSEFVGNDRTLVALVFPFDREQFQDWWGVFDGELPPGFREIGRSGEVIALERARQSP